MNDDLIRRSDAEEMLKVMECNDLFTYNGIAVELEALPAVNAVELPCRIGDIFYIIRTDIYKLTVNEIVSITVKEDDIIINYIGTAPYEQFVRKISTSLIGEIVFFTKEEAEAALRKKKEKRNRILLEGEQNG